MELKNLIGLGAISLFFIYFFFSREKKRAYVIGVLVLLPFVDFVITPERWGSFTVFEVMTYFSLVFFLDDLKFPQRRISSSLILFVILVLLLFLGSLTSEFLLSSLISLSKFLCVFIYAKALMDLYMVQERFSELIIRVLRYICLFSLLFLGMQMIYGLGFSFYTDLNPNTEVINGIRYPGFFADSQKYAQFLSMTSFLFLMIKPNSNRNTIWINYAFFLLVVLAIFLTGGRAGLLGLAFGLGIIFLLGERKFKIFGVIVILAAVVGFAYFSDYFIVFNREQTVNDSFNVRFQIWRDGFTVFSQHPLLGIGIGNYVLYVQEHAQNQYWLLNEKYVYMNHPESGYLKLLAEYGIFSFIIVLWFLFKPVISNLKLFFFCRPKSYNVLFLIASVSAFLISFFTVYSLSDRRILILLTVLLVLLFVSQKSPGNEIYPA